MGELGDLFVADTGGSNIDPQRFARFEAIAARLAAAARQRPLLLVIDDIHAAGAGALLLTRFIARAAPGLPLALLAAGRPQPRGMGADRDRCGETEPREPLLPQADDVGRDAVTVALSPFDLDETAEFLRAHWQQEFEPEAVEAIFRLTGGNPLHLHRTVMLGGDGGAQAPAAQSVLGATQQAIDGLSPAALRLATAGAILGSSVSLAEAAQVAGVPGENLEETCGAGLTVHNGRDFFGFSHDLVREALLDRLSAEQQRELHARIARLLSGPENVAAPDHQVRQLRRARHALHAASRSREDALAGVTACREAAWALRRGFGFEQAAAVLDEAVEAYDHAELDTPLAPLLVEWAEAILRCGRLIESRQAFARAAEQARTESDPEALARAALGLGGVWVNEHRTRLEWEEAVGRQREALDSLPRTAIGLRCRLRVRLAAEHVYRGGPIEPLLEGLEQARGIGDRSVLAEALSLCHHALLRPKYVHQRLAMAEELIAVASAAGEDLLALMGLCWRTTDLFHLGDPRAVRDLNELTERADILGCMSIRYIAEAMDVMLLIRAGRFDEAEDKALKCFELGTLVGDADAETFLGAHLVTLRWLQGRDAEILSLVEQIADSPLLNPAEFAFQATIASTSARLGKHDQARAVLDRLTVPGLAALPESSTWLAGMLAVVETCLVLGEPLLARQAYDLLLPYAALPVTPSLAVTCFGSAHRPLGLAALAFGDTDLAIRHLGEALRANRLLGNHPVTAVTLADLGQALVRRSARHDRARARDLLARARDEARRMGMHTWAESWGIQHDQLSTLEAVIVREGRHWALRLGDHRAVVADRRGVRYLAELLIRPGKQIKVLELTGGGELESFAAQPVLDSAARAAYRRRVKELTELIEDDPDGAPRHRAELGALLEQLRQDTGIGGRSRAFADAHERARTSVRKAIKRAIDEITHVEPEIGALLAETVTTGATCCYTPHPDHPVRWTTR
jgi:tetratricopeptide (TPR) repeat protein